MINIDDKVNKSNQTKFTFILNFNVQYMFIVQSMGLMIYSKNTCTPTVCKEN